MTKTMQLQQMKTKKMNSKAARAVVAGLALAVGTLAVGRTAATAHAQQRGPVRRTIEGRVHDKNDAPVKGAVVYLKDSRTLAVKSFISDDEGTFHFGQLSQNTDYELYAEFDGKRSKSKSVSSFDNKNDFNFTLKIDVGK
jgi:Carboxypeptidase regulatory-like domain